MRFPGGLLAFFLAVQTAAATETTSPESAREWPQQFTKGIREISAGAGIYFSPFIATTDQPTENYAGPLVQFGYMLNTPEKDAGWRGNFEVLGDLSGAWIFEGSGNYIASTTFWLRYNIVPPRWNIAPYLQLGGGFTLSDFDRNVFGQAFNFNLNAAGGLRYFVKQNCSINAEYRYQHISNAGMAEHNLGLNAQGAVLSVSWYF